MMHAATIILFATILITASGLMFDMVRHDWDRIIEALAGSEDE